MEAIITSVVDFMARAVQWLQSVCVDRRTGDVRGYVPALGGPMDLYMCSGSAASSDVADKLVTRQERRRRCMTVSTLMAAFHSLDLVMMLVQIGAQRNASWVVDQERRRSSNGTRDSLPSGPSAVLAVTKV
jgi:hypothetical protein